MNRAKNPPDQSERYHRYGELNAGKTPRATVVPPPVGAEIRGGLGATEAPTFSEGPRRLRLRFHFCSSLFVIIAVVW